MDPPTLPCELAAVPESAPHSNLTQALVHSSQVKSPKKKLQWNAKRVAAIDREWPVIILVMSALFWAVTNVLVLGFTASEIVFIKVLGLTMAIAGAIWVGVNVWGLLHREKA